MSTETDTGSISVSKDTFVGIGNSLAELKCVQLNGNLTFSTQNLKSSSNATSILQFSGYASLTVFHYTVPPEVTRATWEFASFQDHGDCPHRRVRIFLQHGSYPVFRSVYVWLHTVMPVYKILGRVVEYLRYSI